MESMFEKVLAKLKDHYGDKSATLPKFITSTKSSTRYPVFETKSNKPIAALGMMASAVGGNELFGPSMAGELPAPEAMPLGVASSPAAPPPAAPDPTSSLPGEQPEDLLEGLM